MADRLTALMRYSVARMSSCLRGSTPDIAVTDIAGGPCPARLYVPSGAEDMPLILFFHGGGFISCDLDTHDALCRTLAAESGLRLVAIDYRRAPEHPAPAQLDDALAACRWILHDPARPAGDTSRRILAGDSAGAYLAAHAAERLRTEGDAIAALILFYPLIHMDADLWRKPGLRHARWIGRCAIWLMRSRLGAQPLPPITPNMLGRMQQIWIVSGDRFDPVNPDACWLADGLAALGGPHRHTVYPRLFHGALNMPRVSRSARRALRETARALREFQSRSAGD